MRSIGIIFFFFFFLGIWDLGVFSGYFCYVRSSGTPNPEISFYVRSFYFSCVPRPCRSGRNICHVRFFAPKMYCHFRAGYKLTVIDSASDKDWWKGKYLGSVGVFPSNYVAQLHPGEKPLQVTQTIQINGATMQEPPIKLLRDQVQMVV